MHKTSPGLEADVDRLLQDELGLNPRAGILVAVSGGRDSMCMLHTLHQLNYRLQVAHVNFQLRGAESEKDAELVRSFCAQFNLPYHESKFETASIAAQRGKGIQETARDLRYNWFEKIRGENNLDWIATAHHLQDSLETFLINLSRGAGLKGLLGIPAKRGHIIRPFSKVKPQDIQAYQIAHAIPFREDLSNSKTDYTRNTIRLKLLPLYYELPGDPLQAFLQNQNILKQYYKFAKDELEKQKKKFLNITNGQHVIDLGDLMQNENKELLLYEMLSEFNFNATQVNAAWKAQQGAQFYSSSHEACINQGKIYVQKSNISEATELINISEEEGTLHLPEGRLSWTKQAIASDFQIHPHPSYAYLNIEQLKFPLQLRRWQNGDRFQPFGMQGKSKLVSDYFADQKFTAFQKREAWLLCSEEKICWILGQRSSAEFKIKPTDQQVLTLHWQKNS